MYPPLRNTKGVIPQKPSAPYLYPERGARPALRLRLAHDLLYGRECAPRYFSARFNLRG